MNKIDYIKYIINGKDGYYFIIDKDNNIRECVYVVHNKATGKIQAQKIGSIIIYNEYSINCDVMQDEEDIIVPLLSVGKYINRKL